MTDAADEMVVKKGKGCLGWLWRVSLVGVVVLAGLLVWVNGPGMRWLGPKVAGHFLEKAGMEGSLRLGGTLLGGVRVYDLEISSKEGAVERIVVDRLETDYRFLEVIKGKVRGISGQGIHADIRLVETPKEEKPPVDFAAVGKSLGGVREKVLPLELDLKDVSVSVTKAGERVVELEGSNFSHRAGGDVVLLELGRIIDPEGHFTQKQKAEIVWEGDALTLDQLELLPVAGLRDVSVKLPEDGAVAGSADLRLGDGVFRLDVGAGIKDVRLDLVEGELDFGKLLGGFGLGLPVKGKLTSLAVGVEKVFPEWQTGVGTVQVFVEGFSYDGWDVAEASVGLELGEGTFSAKLVGKGFGTDFNVSGGAPFDRAGVAEGELGLGKISGEVNVAEVAELLRGLDTKLDLPVEFAEFPGSTLGGTWAVELGDGGFVGAEGDLTLKAKEAEATPLRVVAEYNKAADLLTVRSFEADGMVFSGSYGLGTQVYEAKQVLKGFDSGRLVPWLEGVGQEVPGSSVVSMDWEGSGNLGDGTMRGEVTGIDLLWKWNEPKEGEAKPPVSAKAGKITYDWPGTAEVDGLVVETQGQRVALDAMLKEGGLELEKFVWSEGGEELASGAGKLPVPKDFSKMKEFLAENTEPLDLKIESKTLPLMKLKPWVAAVEQIDPGATGKVSFAIGGSLAKPEVDALVEILNLSVPGRSELPNTDVTLKMQARDGRAEISAEAVAKDYAPATLEAEMPFLPKKWAENPKSLMTETVKGEIDLPRLELSRFQSLVPGAKELGGVFTGKIVIAGTVGEPAVDGTLKLSGGKFAMEGGAVPPLTGIEMEVKADLKTVKLTGRVGDVAGGNIRIDGGMDLKNAAGDGLGDVNLSMKGTELPLMRNDFLLLRANVSLNVNGPFQSAKLTGEVGIVDSVFYKDMELIPIGAPFLEPSAASLPKVDTPSNPGAAVPAPFSEWTADVVVKTIDPILIRGNLGTGQADVALRIGGKLGDPKPDGKVRLSEVVARLPLSTLSIREGFVTFTPETGFDPVLEIRGSAEPRPYRVSIYVYGPASDPQLVLTSEPPLPENEIMTLLATGTTSSGLEDSQAASSRATQLLIEELRKGRFLFGKQLRPVLGLLDNVDFSLAESDPYDADSYTSATLKLSEKWFLSAGLGEGGDQRALAIWRLRFR